MCLKYTTKICQCIGGIVLRGYLSHRDSKPEAATQVSAASNLSQDGYGNASGWLLYIYYTYTQATDIRENTVIYPTDLYRLTSSPLGNFEKVSQYIGKQTVHGTQVSRTTSYVSRGHETLTNGYK